MAQGADNLNFKSRDFVHLHLHSDYSLLQSTIQLKPLAKHLTDLEMTACAVTDYQNLYGAVSFYNTMKYSGIHPIIGYEAAVTYGSRMERGASVGSGEKPYYSLILLARDITGYHNLVHIASKAFTEGLYHKPRIDLDLLSEFSSGLIALSGGAHGSVAHYLNQNDTARARTEVQRFRDMFGDDNFYLEIQDGNAEMRELTKRTVELSKLTGAPLVASNDAHYLTAEDARAHQILLCIGEGKTIDQQSAAVDEPVRYVRSAQEMWNIFGDELPQALTNSLRIAESCQLEIPMGDLQLPSFPIPPESGCGTMDSYFEQVVREGFEERKNEVLLPMSASRFGGRITCRVLP